MITVKTIETFITFLVIALAYIISATTAGYIQAFVAKKMGDSTPEDAGFLSWNPIVHIDPLGALLLFYTGFGWRKQIPLNYDLIPSSWRLALTLFSHAITHLFVAFFSLLGLIKILGIESINFSLSMALNRYFLLPALSKAYPEVSSYYLSLALFLISLLFLSLVFAVLSLIIDGFRFIAVIFFKENSSFLNEEDFSTFFFSFILILIFAPSIHSYLAQSISQLARFFYLAIGT